MTAVHQGQAMSPEKADELAEQLNTYEEEGWSYRAVHDPRETGLSVIEIYDEDGYFVGLI